MRAFHPAPATIRLAMVSVFMKGSMDHVEGTRAEQAMMDSVPGAEVLLASPWKFPTGDCIH
ncbi:Putative DEAD-box ATP-dependent RNA helicase family protein [Zea mays]|nr:Putative DEAD-box ATP-dependent RNA helicase family protein [Zea mays]